MNDDLLVITSGEESNEKADGGGMETKQLLRNHRTVDDVGNDTPDKTLSFAATPLFAPRNSVTGTQQSVTSMKSGDISRKNTRLLDNPNLFARVLNERLTTPWIEHAFEKRECIRFVPQKGNEERCGCGRVIAAHSQLAQSRFSVFPPQSMGSSTEAWSIAQNTHASPTDAFGTIVFQGGAHAHKAQYVRLGYDSDPANVLYLMEKVWGLQPPRLVITVHGGTANFEVQAKLGEMFREGLLKAAQTTGAWIITSGLDSGVVKHVAQALDDAGISARMRSRVVTIGIAPWGVIRRRERLISKDGQIQYDSRSFGGGGQNGIGILNDRHSYFLLADNGTSGRFGADQHLRLNFENHLARMAPGNGTRTVPVVCTVLEGGTQTMKIVHEYLTVEPDIPCIVCDGSGRASDLLAFASRYMHSDGSFPSEVQEQLLALISTVFPDNSTTPQQLLDIIVECARKTDLLTVFRLGEDKQGDVDHAILTAVLRRHNLSLPDQLSLTLSWNRVDVARACLFGSGRNWPSHALHSAMSEALRLNRVEFVELLLENGVCIKNFTTITTLEQLYNLDDDSVHSVRFLVEPGAQSSYLSLPDIGILVEKLMGNAYKHCYTSRAFKSKYEKYRKKAQLSRLSTFHIRLVAKSNVKRRKSGEQHLLVDEDGPSDFQFPFNDLMLWAVLTRRPEMARCLWLHGEDAMAKSLVAMRLYKSMARIAEQDYLEVEMGNRLKERAEEFRSESLSLLDFLYRADNEETLRLLTAALPQWGHQNCLSLAVLANNKAFLAHPCCQMLLAELWHGSLRVRSGSNLRVIMSLLCPPAALLLHFKPLPVIQKPETKTLKHDTEYGNDDTLSSLPTAFTSSDNHKVKRESVGSLVSMQLSKLFGNANGRMPLDRCSREELHEFGEGSSKKVTIVTSRKSSTISVCGSNLSLSKKRDDSLPWLSRLNAFYSAPISKFWSWCLSFHVFLTMYSYFLLIKTPIAPSQVEWLTLIYVTGFAFEHFRKLLAQESPKIIERCRVYYTKYYNILTFLALMLFFIGFAFRLVPDYRHSYGRVILCCSNVLWYMKMLEYLSVHPLLGPYIQMAAKMVVSMCYIIVLLLVTLMAFGVSRQAITYPKKDWDWILVRNIFYKPYFMLYGEVYAGEIDTCGDDGNSGADPMEGMNCVPGGFIPPILMTIFLLVANILLINMLIAIFNNIFNETNERSQEVWLFQRYGQVMEYNDTPILPPPFNVISYIAWIAVKICKRKTQDTNVSAHQFSMKLHLNGEELRKVHDFEEDCMDELTRKRTTMERGTMEDRMDQTLETTEFVAQKLAELLQENFSLKNRLLDVEDQLQTISKQQQDMVQIDTTRRKISKAGSHRESSQSLPDSVESNGMLLRRRHNEYSTITDHITAPGERKMATSPLLNHLRMDHTLRKYDEARYHSPLLQRRPRLNSSSLSITQDMREMNRNTKTSMGLSDDDVPSVIVRSPDDDELSY